MEAEEPPFSCIVDSGNGYQAYKFIAPFTVNNADDVAKVEAANRAINESLNARLIEVGVKADSCWSIDHLMRAPGTTNFMTAKKREKGYPEGDRPSRVVAWHPELVYNIEDLPKIAAPINDGPRPTEPSADDSVPFTTLDDIRLIAVSPDVMTIIRTGRHTDATADMKAGHVHFKIVAELLRAGLSDVNVKQLYRLSPLGTFVAGSARGFDGYLNRLIAAVRTQAIDTRLFEMNERHCVLPIGGKTRVVTWGEDARFPGHEAIVASSAISDFRSLYDKYRHSYQKDGETVVERLGSWWIRHPHRRQYDGGMKFMPHHDEEVVGNVLNLWRGFAVIPRKPEGKSGAKGCKLFLDHGLNVICSGNAEHYDYLIKREAFIAQKRTRSEIAVALCTEEEGTGKGFWCRAINHLYSAHAMQVQNPEHVIGKHNPHLEKLLRLTADEALFAGNPLHRNALYGLITEPTITIEPKFVDAYEAENFLNIDLLSNARHFIPVSGTARRFFVPTVSSAKASNHEYFRKIMAQLNNGGYEALLYHLLHEIDITGFNVRAVPRTAALIEQAGYSRKGVDRLIEILCNEGRVPYSYDDSPGFSDTTGYDNHYGFDYFIDHHADKELSRMGALTIKRRLAKEWGCITGKHSRMSRNGAQITGIIWPSLTELRQRFVDKYGPQEWLFPDLTEWQRPGTVPF
jgi:hypothetical protein